MYVQPLTQRGSRFSHGSDNGSDDGPELRKQSQRASCDEPRPGFRTCRVSTGSTLGNEPSACTGSVRPSRDRRVVKTMSEDDVRRPRLDAQRRSRGATRAVRCPSPGPFISSSRASSSSGCHIGAPRRPRPHAGAHRPDRRTRCPRTPPKSCCRSPRCPSWPQIRHVAASRRHEGSFRGRWRSWNDERFG